MRGTVHLKDSQNPLIEGGDETANCGVLVKNAVAVFMVSEDIGVPYSARMCKRCWGKDQSDQFRYVYGLCAGEEIKNALGLQIQEPG